jgi:hypothetical protein
MLVRQRELSNADAERRRRLPVPCMSSRCGYAGIARTLRMKMSKICLAAALFVALAASATLAADVSIIGRWQITEAAPAPWAPPEHRAALAAAGKRMIDTEVTFAPGSVKSKFKPLDCKSKVLYESSSIEVDALFQGNLPEPNPAAVAARLGFPKGDIPSVDVRCLKALYTFHFRDPNTALINLDRVIYTLKRQ